MEVLHADVSDLDPIAAENMENLLKEYRKKVIGESCLESAPDQYWEIGTVTELHWSLSEWRQLPLRERAMITARAYLKNMVDTIDRAYEENDQAKKRNQEDIERRRQDKKRR